MHLSLISLLELAVQVPHGTNVWSDIISQSADAQIGQKLLCCYILKSKISAEYLVASLLHPSVFNTILL